MLFRKSHKTSQIEIVSPIDGTVVSMAALPDAVFASGMLGVAVGVVPAVHESVTVHAPLAGVIENCAETCHAVGIRSFDGKTSVLVHAGIDTVAMGGRGFTLHVTEGAQVSTGDALLTMDGDAVEAAGHSSMVIVVVTETPVTRTPVDVAHVAKGDALFW